MDITQNKQTEQLLLETRQRLESQVATTKEELDKIKEETAGINIALNVLLKHRTSDKSDAQIALAQEVEEAILPFLKKLKGTSTGRIQTSRLIGILESNLLNLVKEYGLDTNHLSAVNKKLTPVERQVVSMIRQGLGTKVIAATLNCSTGTVGVHRKHIRKKLGLDSKASNLFSYLQSLPQ
jgi:DNA-binding NarL/FixJ family response regulator